MVAYDCVDALIQLMDAFLNINVPLIDRMCLEVAVFDLSKQHHYNNNPFHGKSSFLISPLETICFADNNTQKEAISQPIQRFYDSYYAENNC